MFAVKDDKIWFSPEHNNLLTLAGFTDTSELNGHMLRSVPHTLDNCMSLRKVGLPVRSPMGYDNYKWPGRYKPFDHQKVTSDFLALHERAFCFNDMGTGKTSSVLWAIDYLIKSGHVRRALIIAPLSCLSPVWQSEAFNVVPHLSVAVVHGSKAQRQRALDSDAKLLVINHDGIKVMADELIADEKLDLVVADECTAFKNSTTTRFKVMKKLTAMRSLWMLTGTPMPQNPEDAWAQAKLVDPGVMTLGKFRQATMKRGHSDFQWIPRPEAPAIVRSVLQPAIRFKKEDCLTLPPQTVSYRVAKNSADQDRMIKSLMKQFAAEAKQGDSATEVTAANAAVRLSKIMQVLQGAVLDEHGTAQSVPMGNRVDIVRELIDQSYAKSIVFAPYTATIKMLRKELSDPKYNYKPLLIDGSVSQSERAAVVEMFQNSPENRVIIAHPKTASHGLTLTAASTTIWFSPFFSVEGYIQANNRTNRPGQVNHTSVFNVYSHPLEQKIYEAVEKSMFSQDTLLQMYEEMLGS